MIDWPTVLLTVSKGVAVQVRFTEGDLGAWMQALRGIAPSEYASDPVGWVRDVLGEYLWSKQVEIMHSVLHNRYTAVQSCHGAGKSFVTSRIVAWWLATKPLGQAYAVTTAPTAAQVSSILWREIRRAHRKGALTGYITGGTVPKWKLADGSEIGIGRKPADHDQAAFQGLHDRYLLAAIDEASGVPRSLFDAVDSLATNEMCRVIAIGNPDDPASHFAKICEPGSGWNVIRIDALESPLFTEEACAEYPELAALMESLEIPYSTEEIPEDMKPMLVSPLWVSERIKRWGVTSPIFEAKVRGSFPEIGEDILITPKMIREAQLRELVPINYKVMGVDVARFGSDRTVLGVRSGPVFRVHGDYSKLDTIETSQKVVDLANKQRPNEIRVDGVGIGGGVVDQLNASEALSRSGVDIIDMQAGAGPMGIDQHLFHNARAEWYWDLRTRFENGLIDIDPDDDELAAQLGALRYKYTDKGKIIIESKDDLKKRGLPSPDRADVLMLTSPVSDYDGSYVDEELSSYSISPV